MSRVLIDEDRFFAWTRKDKEALAEIEKKDGPPKLFTVPQFSDKHPAFPPGGLRYRIFNSATNGLDEFGAVVRLPREAR